MNYCKVRNVNTKAEAIVTQAVYDAYPAEYIMLIEKCDPTTGKKFKEVKKVIGKGKK